MTQIQAYLNFTVGDLLAATDTQMLTTVIQSFQSQSAVAINMYQLIEKTVLSNMTDTNDVAETNTDSETDPYDNHVHNYDNCKWGFVLMNKSFPDAVFDYTALCCFEEGNIISMNSDPNWNNSALIDCYERAYFSDVPKEEQPCYVVPSRWGYPLQENHQAYSQFDFLKWLPLIAFLLVLSFVMTTRRKTNRGGTLCNGFIGIPEVINMLDNERTRWVSAALFFSFGYQLFLMVVHPLDVDLPFYELKLGNVTFLEKKLIIIAYYLMVYAPLVMGLPRYDFYGSLISLLYTWMITIHNYTRDYACATDPWTWLFKLPEHIAWTLLSLLIPVLMIRVATINIKSNKKSLIGRFNERYIKYINGYENWKEENYYFHTVDLATSSKVRNTSKTAFERYCWSANNLFKYHSRLLSIVLTSMLAIYVEVLVLVLIYRPYVHKFTRETIEGWRSIAPYVIMFDQFLSSQGQDNLFDADKVGWYLQVFQTYVGVIPACFNIAIVIAILVTCFNLYRMLINYREHCKQVIRGDYSEVHVTKHTPTSLMTGNLKYQAYQTAYISIGFIIQLYLFFTVLILLCWLFILPLSVPIVSIRGAIVHQVSSMWPALLYLLASVILQNLLCRFLILQNPQLNTAIDNRRVYNLFAYFFFFNNIFVGVGSLVLRTFYGVIFGLLNIQRMDIPTLSYVYEGFDAGYTAYVGFQIVRKTHTHPVALSFISLLLDSSKNQARKKSGKTDSFLRAQSNWHLAYSIINNQSLRLSRKHYEETGSIKSLAKSSNLVYPKLTKTDSIELKETNNSTTSLNN